MKRRSPLGDKQDAFGLAEQLRIGAIETRVYKERGQFVRLGNLAKAYGFLVGDTVRVKNRGRASVPALSEPVGRRNEAEPGEAHHRASDRLWR